MPNIFTTQPITLKILLAILAGVILLRLAGKRSISQLTVPEVVLMISIGTLLIQPVNTENEWVAIYGAILLVLGMIVLSRLQIAIPWMRKWVIGVPTVLIRDGRIDVNELKRARMNTDELEMRLRLLNVENIEEVELAILEISGQMSVRLVPHTKPANKNDIQQILHQLEIIHQELAVIRKLRMSPSPLPYPQVPDVTAYEESSLFDEARIEEAINKNLTTH